MCRAAGAVSETCRLVQRAVLLQLQRRQHNASGEQQLPVDAASIITAIRADAALCADETIAYQPTNLVIISFSVSFLLSLFFGFYFQIS